MTKQTINPTIRRDFLKPAVAGGSDTSPPLAGDGRTVHGDDFNHLVPADKKLSSEWVKSLFVRATPEVLRGGELKYVGMPPTALVQDSFISAAMAGSGIGIFSINPSAPAKDITLNR